jgi:glutamate racemase
VKKAGPIGVFDSGYGGLTVLKALTTQLPQYDYLYLGDNARVPYGSRSFETVYQYTLECVEALFAQGCQLVVLACNTASAKALRSIQQNDLPKIAPHRRVLGVIRPTTEEAGLLTKSGHLGVLGTSGTVLSNSYPIEIAKFYPELTVSQEACPMWVPLVENNEHLGPGADYFLAKHLEALLQKDPAIDAVILGCTHYPLLQSRLEELSMGKIKFIAQGTLVAQKLELYLQRHPEIAALCSKNESRRFLTTDDARIFEEKARLFYGEKVEAKHIDLSSITFSPDA